MDRETIQQIATEISRHLSAEWWIPLVIQGVLVAIVAAIAAVSGAYLKERGKNLATKADFEALKEQLRTNTELVETIKSDVGQRDWARREWASTRRTKLEELLVVVNDCHHFRELLRFKAVEGEYHNESDPISTVKMIATLYFPELDREVTKYRIIHIALVAQTRRLAGNLNTEDDLSVKADMLENYNAYSSKCEVDLVPFARELETSARKVLEQIAGVETTATNDADRTPIANLGGDMTGPLSSDRFST